MTADRERSKKITREIFKKHGLGKKVKKDAVAARVAGQPAPDKKETTKDLRTKAKAAGIKYFGVLNRLELVDVLNLHARGNQEPAITLITTAAKERWQKSWGTGKKRKPEPIGATA
jgi:hypothetical protein